MTRQSPVVCEDKIPARTRAYSKDMAGWLLCGLSVQACPVDALAMTKEYEWAVYDKRD